jgi:hypothetical protein
MPLPLEVGDAVRALTEARRSLPLAFLDRPVPVTAAETVGAVPMAVVPAGEAAIMSVVMMIEMIAMTETAMVLDAAAMLESAAVLEAVVLEAVVVETKIVPALTASEPFVVRGRAVYPEAPHVAAESARSERPAHAAMEAATAPGHRIGVRKENSGEANSGARYQDV